MKLPITIEYSNGDAELYIAQVSEWAKWENKTGNTIAQAQDKMGISDLLFLAYHAMKRESGGKPVKPYEIWCETVSDIIVGDANPKVTEPEA
jgi:hypothetical protein